MFESLKKIIQTDGERVIIVEDGKPCFVLLTFEEYQQLRNVKNPSIIDKTANANVLNSKTNMARSVENFSEPTSLMNAESEDAHTVNSKGEPQTRPSNVRIEDIPF